MPAPIVTLPVVLDTSAIPRQFADAVLKAQRAVKPLSVRINPLPLGKITGDVLELNKSLTAAGARVIAFTATTGALYGMARAFTSIVKSTVEVEKRLTQINVLLGASNSGYKKLSDGLFQIAKQTALGFDQAASAAEEFARQGLPLNETLKRTRDALVLTSTSGIDAKDAVSALTAAVNTFRKEALDTTTVINKLANVDADFAVSQKDLAAAISRAGAAAQDAGVSFDELLGIVTSLQQTTTRGGATIGNAIKAIFTRVQRPQVLEDLKGLGVEVETLPGKTAPALQILTNLAQKYYQLSDAQKSLVSEKVAGGYQINQLKALLSDLARANSLVLQATRTSAGSTTEAFSRQRDLNKSIASQAAIAATNIKKSFAAIGDLTIGPSLKGLLGSFNRFFEKAGEETNSESVGEKIGVGILTGISSAIKGPGTIFAIAVLSGLLKRIGSFAISAVKDIAGLNNTVKEQQLLQGSINQLLASGNSYYVQRFREATSVTEQEKIVLALLRAQNAEMAKRASASSVLTSFMSSRFSGSETGAISTRAGGYVPSAAGGLIPALQKEQAAINAGTGGADGARPALVKNFPFGAGQNGSVVANTKEYVVKNFVGGKGSAIFNPDMVRNIGGLANLSKLGQVDKVASGGFIPNFAFKQLGTGAFGRVLQFVRGSKTLNIGKKVFDGYQSKTLAKINPELLDETIIDDYQAKAVLAVAKKLGALPTGIGATKPYGSLKRTLARREMGVEIAPGKSAHKFLGMQGALGADEHQFSNLSNLVNGTTLAARKSLEDIGIIPNDLHSDNYIADSKFQNTLLRLSKDHGKFSEERSSKLIGRLLRSGKFGNISITDPGSIYLPGNPNANPKELLNAISSHKNKYKVAANGLFPALVAEKALTGENPKVGTDARLPQGVGVYSPSQGSLAHAIDQHLKYESGRTLNNLGKTGAAAQGAIPNFALPLTPVGAANRLDGINAQLARFIERQEKLNRQKERELLIAKTLSDDALSDSEKRRLTKFSQEDILNKLGTNTAAVLEAKRANPAAFAASGLKETVFDKAKQETNRLVSEGKQEKIVRDFADKFITKVGVFSSTSRATDKYISQNSGSLTSPYISRIRDIGRARGIENTSTRQQRLFGASFLAPVITDAAVSYFGNPNSQGGRFASGVGSAGGAALNFGTLLGLVGKGKLGLAGGLATFAGGLATSANNAISDPLDKYQKANTDVAGRLEEQSNAISSVTNAYETLRDVLSSGGTNESSLRAQKQLGEAFNQVRPGPEREKLYKAITGSFDASDSLVNIQSDFASSVAPKQRNIRAVNSISDIFENATVSNDFLVNRLSPNRRSVVQAFTSQNPTGLESFEKNKIGLLSGLGSGAGINQVRGSIFKDLSGKDLQSFKEELISNTIGLEGISKVDLKSFVKRFNKGEDSAALLSDLFSKAGQDPTENKRLTEALLSSSLNDTNAAFKVVIETLQNQQSTGDLSKRSRELLASAPKFAKLTDAAINSVWIFIHYWKYRISTKVQLVSS
jgi:TP901 family phage tail tape measure protein